TRQISRSAVSPGRGVFIAPAFANNSAHPKYRPSGAACGRGGRRRDAGVPPGCQVTGFPPYASAPPSRSLLPSLIDEEGSQDQQGGRGDDDSRRSQGALRGLGPTTTIRRTGSSRPASSYLEFHRNPAPCPVTRLTPARSVRPPAFSVRRQ